MRWVLIPLMLLLVGVPRRKERIWTDDTVNHPPHYNKGIATTQYIKSWGMNWNQSNVIKYVSRYNLKSSNLKLQIQDLKKAQWYLNDLINDLENNDS